MQAHGRKLWWLHSVYAMGLGTFVVLFAQKGFWFARWLTLFLVAIWLGTLLVFRRYGSGRTQKVDTPQARLRFHLWTYVLKNLYQGMLFFVLPFYWKSASFDALNGAFVVLIAICAVLATLDVVFDQVLMRWRLLGSAYYFVALFASLNLALPALVPMDALATLQISAGLAVMGFWSLNFPLRALVSAPRGLAMLAVAVLATIGLAWGGRRIVPPVPLSLAAGAVGPRVLPDGRLAMRVTALHASVMKHMRAVTDVASPTATPEQFVHVWRQNGREVLRLVPTQHQVDRSRVRLASELYYQHLPSDRAGPWTIDVETADGQLVGRTRFSVLE